MEQVSLPQLHRYHLAAPEPLCCRNLPNRDGRCDSERGMVLLLVLVVVVSCHGLRCCPANRLASLAGA